MSLNIFLNVISVDYADYVTKMRGNPTYLNYIDFDPESFYMSLRAQPDSNNCMSIIFIEPEHHLPDKFFNIVENIIEHINSDLYVTDVGYIGRNKILCLFY